MKYMATNTPHLTWRILKRYERMKKRSFIYKFTGVAGFSQLSPGGWWVDHARIPLLYV